MHTCKQFNKHEPAKRRCTKTMPDKDTWTGRIQTIQESLISSITAFLAQIILYETLNLFSLDAQAHLAT